MPTHCGHVAPSPEVWVSIVGVPAQVWAAELLDNSQLFRYRGSQANAC